MTASGIAQPENVDILWDNAANSLQNIEGAAQNGAIEVKYDTDDATALSDLADDHTLGIRDPGNFDFVLIYTRTVAEIARQNWRCIASKTHSINFLPDGAELHAFESLMTGFELETTLGQTAKLSIKNKITGAITLTPAS